MVHFPTTMKLLCSSDLHGDRESYLRFASGLARPDYVAGVLAGDLIDEYPTARDDRANARRSRVDAWSNTAREP